MFELFEFPLESSVFTIVLLEFGTSVVLLSPEKFQINEPIINNEAAIPENWNQIGKILFFFFFSFKRLAIISQES